jgi:phage FluMu gp28-like protein
MGDNKPQAPPQSTNECYTIGFDISSTGDISVATVFQVVGNIYKHVNTFTGEEAKWMYNRITNIKI